jgi:hypothetical protein
MICGRIPYQEVKNKNSLSEDILNHHNYSEME